MTKNNSKLNLTVDENDENIIDSSSVTIDPIKYTLSVNDVNMIADSTNLEYTSNISVSDMSIPIASDPSERDTIIDQVIKKITESKLGNEFTNKSNTIPNEKPVTRVEYRGFSIPIYQDSAGQQFYCIWEGQELDFGAYNTDFVDDLKDLIDRKLDIVYTFDLESGFFGARLEWFDNAGNRDIRLLYRGRILKVFLMESIKSDGDLKEVLPYIVQDAIILLEFLVPQLNKEENN